MTDFGKKDDEFDWDAALDEWENKAFQPEVAKDRETQRPALLATQPPVGPAVVETPAAPPIDLDDEGEPEPTRVKPIPESIAKLSAPRPIRGGLGQLFGRPDAPAASPAPPAPAAPLPPARAQEITRPALAELGDRDAVVTSAKHHTTGRGNDRPEESLKRPVANEHKAADGELFNPFADPEAPAAVHRHTAPTTPPPPPPPSAGGVTDLLEPLSEGRILLSPAVREHDPDIDTSTFDVRSIPFPAPPPDLPPPVRKPPPPPPSAPRASAPDIDASAMRPDELEDLDAFEEVATGELEQVAREDGDVETRVYELSGEPPEIGELEELGPAEEIGPDGDVVLSPADDVDGAPALEQVESARSYAPERDAAAKGGTPAGNAVLARARWLESEARSLDDLAARARQLLVASELHALQGDTATARQLALEARDLAPEVALVHFQVRGLSSPDAPTEIVEAIDVALASDASKAAKAHAILYAADVLRANGDDEAARQRWDAVAALAPDDARVVLGRAAAALARDELTGTALEVPAGDDLRVMARAVSAARRVRGADALPGNDEFLAADSLRKARLALQQGEVAKAGDAVAELSAVPELRLGAAWLAFALRGTSTAQRAASLEGLRIVNDPRARRALAARAMELGDATAIEKATTDEGTFSPPERLVLAVLGGAGEDAIHALASEVAREGAAYGALVAATDPARLAGDERDRRALHLGRVLSRGDSNDEAEGAVRARMQDEPNEASPLALDFARRAERWSEVIDGIRAWQRPEAALAAALLAERVADTTSAKAAYSDARAADPKNETALRALAALDSAVNLPTGLLALADEIDGVRGALLRLEAVSRHGAFDDDAKLSILEQIQRSVPDIPIASFLAERIARRHGTVDVVLRWIRNRRAIATDPLESAIDAVREALLVADADAVLASELLEEAHRARPDDFALRDLYERLSAEPPADRAAWREARASRATGDTQKLLLLEAAHDYERIGDKAGALRAATAAASGSTSGLERIVLERTEVLAGSVARLSDELLEQARGAEDPVLRREAYERLSDLDLTGRNDAGSALLWHRAILDDVGSHPASLRHVEQALLSEGRDDELVPIFIAVAQLLDGTTGGECTAHAEIAARLMMRGGDWDGTREIATLARRQPMPALWALRLHNAHARAHSDHSSDLESTLALAARATRSPEIAALLVRAADAANRVGDTHQAKALYERAAKEDPGDVVAWQRLGDACTREGDRAGAAAAFESVARSSVVRAHQLAAWYDAAILWLDGVNDIEHGTAALEQAASIQVTHADVFPRLSSLYAASGARAELAALLEKRGESITDPNERVVLEIERGRVLAEVGDTAAAKTAFEVALEQQPDHAGALAGYGDLAASIEDWETAEKAWVRLARLLSTPEEQTRVYMRLGDLYFDRAPNLSRAELAYQEVLKRAPDDIATMERLVQVYCRQNDPARALEMQQALIGRATDASDRRRRLIELSVIHEETSHDARKAEQALETARREFPADVGVLRALAEFYTRHKQGPAVHMLLDRAAADARRAFGAGRFAPAIFEIMAAVYDLRGKKDASNVVSATLAAYTAAPATIHGADARSGDVRLDEVLAPDALSPALRALLARTGDALDAVYPVDARAIHAAALPSSAQSLRDLAQSIAAGMGIQGLQMYVSPDLGSSVLAAGSTPPTIVVGEALLAPSSVLARTFLLVRALKLVQAHAAALPRVPAKDLPALIAAWLQAFNPTWQPQGIPAPQLAEIGRRLSQVMARRVDPDVGLIALEVAGSIGTLAAALGPAALTWANRTGLLAVGDPNAALDGIAWTLGQTTGAPRSPQERASWIARTPEAKEIIAYSVSEQYSDARTRAGAAR
jgi:tetratricopeptide (TPR) repeat protein